MSTDTAETSDTSRVPMLGFKVVVFDHHGGEGPEMATGSIVFSHWFAIEGDSFFTYRDIAIGMWNLTCVLEQAHLLVLGTCWALAPEDGPDPVNCHSGDWPGREYEAVTRAWDALTDERTHGQNRVDTSLYLRPA